jgi:23S rRNA pseudouridine1911/1915/1917 synthase
MPTHPMSYPTFTVSVQEDGITLAAFVRTLGLAASWNQARQLVAGGKLYRDGIPATDPAMRLRSGMRFELRRQAPRPREALPGRIVYDDAQLVVLDKPAGISSVPYERRESGTAMDLIRDHWRMAGKRATEVPLHVVHRIDKETSGLIVFAKTRLCERVLGAAFRAHTIERTYLCVVHGAMSDRRIESHLVVDRGDGLRGSTRVPGQGKRAVTHVRVREMLAQCTVCEVRLETGKTHQIRIHLSEAGHPVVGETVYIRDWLRRDRTPLSSSRLLLHAATLGLIHPTTEAPLQFESPLPPDFVAMLAKLRRQR